MPSITLTALGADGEYSPLRADPITSVSGELIGELAAVPLVWVTRQLQKLGTGANRSVSEREELLRHAATLFISGEFAGMDYEAYRQQVSKVSGLPITVVRSATDVIATAMEQACQMAYAAMPAAACAQWAEAEGFDGAAVWTRKGTTLAVNAAGNHPGVHSLWLEAVALGYSVAVRPSRREPLTAHRMICALRAAGFTGLELQYIPGDQDIVGPLINYADFGLVYGGPDVAAKFGSDPRVLVQGPGRSKVAVGGDITARVLDIIVSSVASQGGTACINATAIYCAQDHRHLAQLLADRLGSIEYLAPTDENAVLPSTDRATAEALQRALHKGAGNATAVLGADQLLRPGEQGHVTLAPTVYVCDSADAVQAGIELPYPCVWVLPWPLRNPEPLTDSLVVTLIDAPHALVDTLIDDASVRNVYVGDVPTHWMRLGLPHDGYLGEFLMESKTVNIHFAS